MKPVFYVILGLLIASSCTPTKTVESDVGSGNINVDAPYLWSSAAFPRNLKISSDFSTDELANIQAMSDAWETAVENKKNFFTNTERTPEVSSNNLNLDDLGDDDIFGVYKITHWPLELNAGALAVTQLFGRRYNIGDRDEYVRIEHADVLINENLYDFRTADGAGGGTYDLRTVVLHELGHFLGLSHKYGNTVMVPSIGTGSVARTPTSVDTIDLADKYHLTIGSGSSNAAIGNARPRYSPRDSGQKVKIMIELRADGECVHKENGAVIGRHSIK